MHAEKYIHLSKRITCFKYFKSLYPQIYHKFTK